MEKQDQQATGRTRSQSERDIRLVKKAQAGSDEAFTQLYRNYEASLFAFVRMYMHSDQDTSDVVQETFIYALDKLSELKDPATFKTWLFRVALSKATDALRQYRRRAGDLTLDALDSEENAAHKLREMEWGADTVFDQVADRAELLDCLNKLTSAQKDVLILRYCVGFNAADVGDMLGLSKEAVRKRTHDARSTLRTLTPNWQTILLQFPSTSGVRRKSTRPGRPRLLCGKRSERFLMACA